MQPSKKISMIEFFYLALLLTSTRPPDQQNLLPRIRSLRPVAQESGALIADDYYYANSLRNDLVNNGIFSTKSSILLHETLDALDVINSLGRYGRPYSSNLIAFPVSQGFSNDGLIDGVIEESDDPGSFRLSNEPLNSLSDDIFGLNISVFQSISNFIESINVRYFLLIVLSFNLNPHKTKKESDLDFWGDFDDEIGR